MVTGVIEVKGKPGIERWLMFFVVLVTWVISASITYGIISTRIEWLDQRIDTIEREIPGYLPRTEYEGSRTDVANRLERIERKLDNLAR